MSDDDAKEKLERLRKENDALKKSASSGVRMNRWAGKGQAQGMVFLRTGRPFCVHAQAGIGHAYAGLWAAPAPRQFHCMTTMKSVSCPVSLLMPWSDTMSEEPGVSRSAIRSITSGDISMRSRMALALSGDEGAGVVSTICLPGWRPLETCAVGGNFSGIEITVQRSAAPSSAPLIAVNTCVPRGSCGSWTVIGLSNSGAKA